VKIKVKDEMDKIKINVSHKELVLISEALRNYHDEAKDTNSINDMLFDKDEFENSAEIDKEVWEMFLKIYKVLDNIYVY
jgi:hypothetical protein